MDIPPSYEEAAGTNREQPPGEIINEGDCIWIRDDFPLWGPAANELAIADRALVEWAVSRRCVVTNGVTYFVYCRNTASWAQMESVDSACELLDTTDTKAYVNYGTALMKFYPLLRRVSNPIKHIERSVCIGTWRLTFSVTWESFGPVAGGQDVRQYHEQQSPVQDHRFEKGPRVGEQDSGGTHDP